MGSLITQGLSGLLIGDPSTSGVMPNTLTKIGAIYKDSFTINQDQAEVTPHFEEGDSFPMFISEDLKMPTFAGQLMDADPDLLALTIGGSVSSGKWGFDGKTPNQNKAIRAQTSQGMVFDIPNGRIRAVINTTLSKKNIFLLDFVITPMAVTANSPFYAYTNSALTVSSNALTFTSSADSTGQTVTATSTGNLTYAGVPSGQDWLTVTRTGKVATVKVLANTNSEARSTILTMVADGKTATVTVTQAGA